MGADPDFYTLTKWGVILPNDSLLAGIHNGTANNG